MKSPAGRTAERPLDVIEAAGIDGASQWDVFRYMTLPHLRQYLELSALLGSIYVVQNFDAVFSITSGGLGTANPAAPVVTPGIASAALICVIFRWNELLFARVLTGTVAQTAPVFLTGFVTSQGLFLAKVCAAALVVSLPVLIAGFAAQDKLVQGLSLGAVK